jgi:hypothetical protein
MRIVAFQAIANGGKMNASLDFTGILILMALDTKLDRRYRLEIYASHLIGCAHLVAA